ncbi:MAG TPA: hypothetical protein VGI03_11015 [Verrucomicrobiae bacterium]|jgi:hypothetical protein
MKPKVIPILFVCVICATLSVGFEAGKTAFTTHYETALLEEPQPLAKSVATLPFAASVNITALQGHWAQVSSTNGSGWIYLGNLAGTKPFENNSVAGLQTSASATTASVAARPLDNVTAQYDDQEGLGKAADDVKWLESQSDAISNSIVVDYLKANKKGEYQ